MMLDRLVLQNFRCFDATPHEVRLAPGLTTLIGANGAGKTALMVALTRMFGTNTEQRRIRRSDFYVSPDEEPTPGQTKNLSLEAYFSFPELEGEEVPEEARLSVPQFFHQMANTESGQLQCRIRLDATLVNDGSIEGAIDERIFAIQTLADDYTAEQCFELRSFDRNRVQVTYIPAVRDGISQLSSLLKGRLWRAIEWSATLSDHLAQFGEELNNSFTQEAGVTRILDALTERWRQVHWGGTDANPMFRPVDPTLDEFIKRVDVHFTTTDTQLGTRTLKDLSDGQRSIFHIATMAAVLDIETELASNSLAGFIDNTIPAPALTIVAVEEPENSLSPYYLSRIVSLLKTVTDGLRAQALISSHSASTLARVEPEDVRYFRIDSTARASTIRELHIPQDDEEAHKYLRGAVHAYPELYFAHYVILGEGASEQVVIPRIADAAGFPIDQSFVAVVPLAGRHVNHLWKLLHDLEIPHATLVDLDLGRYDSGWGRVRDVTAELLSRGISPDQLFPDSLMYEDEEPSPEIFANRPDEDIDDLKLWLNHLSNFKVFFSWPLDLDMAMLLAYPDAYQIIDEGKKGPQKEAGGARDVVLGDHGDEVIPLDDETYRWYRYLFLGNRGKPSTHTSAISRLDKETLMESCPDELRDLINSMISKLTAD